MPAQYIYSHSIGSNVDLSARVRAYRTTMKANAEEGSVAISSVIVDDEESGIDIRGLRQFDWQESSESSNSRVIMRGFTADRDIDRGPFRVQRGRQWTVNVTDLNEILTRRIMRGADANRPAETDVARIQWMVSTVEMNVLTDSTYISTTGPVAMDAVDYRNQRCIDIIDDCAQQSGKNYFLILNELFSPARLGLFYDFAGSTAYASTVRLTNVLADVDSSTTFEVLNDQTKLNRDPSRVYPTIIVPYTGGDVYLHDTAIRDAFHHRDTMAPAVNVKTVAAATVRGLRYLSDAATEEDRLTMSYLVPLALVNRLREGHTFQVKFSHLPGYTDWTWVRALSRTVTATSEEYYTVLLEAGPASSSAAPVLACAAQVPPQEWDSGAITGTLFPTVSVAPASPSTYPGVVIVGWIGRNSLDAMGDESPTLANFTVLGHSRPGSPPPTYSSLTMVGYKALTSGSPGNYTVGWEGSGYIQAHRGIAVYLETAATSPVQTASQLQSGNTATFGSAPTVGNIIIAVHSCEGTPGGVVAGWTLIDSVSIAVGIGGMYVQTWAHCVQEGDDASFLVTEESASHWTFLSEWALT